MKVNEYSYTDLLSSDVDGLVEDDPGRRLPASRVRRRALVRHVIVRLR